MGLEQWYDNKALFELIQELKEQIASLKIDMQQTQTMIRDYNGLRERIDRCEQSMAEASGSKSGGKDTWGYIVGGIGLLMALISYAVR